MSGNAASSQSDCIVVSHTDDFDSSNSTSAYLFEPTDASYRQTGLYAPGRDVLPAGLAVPLKKLADALAHQPFMVSIFAGCTFVDSMILTDLWQFVRSDSYRNTLPATP